MPSLTSILRKAQLHNAKWNSLCERYLPVQDGETIWRYSQSTHATLPEQGWKLHVSASILSANKAFSRVAPYLKQRDVLFKAPCSLEELEKLNAGLFYGYSQVGKFITVYPRSDSEAVSLASQLDLLTRDLPAPVVPFDSQLGPGSNVFYRYGSFNLRMEDGGDAICDPDGKLSPDRREIAKAPDWVVDPFLQQRIDAPRPSTSLLNTPFRVIRAISQRGKGGVYEGVDFQFDPPRPCIIKQGRVAGEVGWDGKDGAWMLKKEAETLRRLVKAGIDVPAIYSTFTLNNHFYLVMEQIEGETLQSLLEKRQRRLTIPQIRKLARKLWTLLKQIHNAGWVWLDCKPANLILTPQGHLRPIDFEGACARNSSRSTFFQTRAFTRTGNVQASDIANRADDLYAFGVTCYFLLTGRLPEKGSQNRIGRWRPGVPRELQNLVEGLLNSTHSEETSRLIERELEGCNVASN